MKRGRSYSYLRWAACGGFLGLLVGSWIAFDRYMNPDLAAVATSTELNRALARVMSGVISGGLTPGTLGVPDPMDDKASCQRLAGVAQVCCTIATSQMALDDTSGALETLRLIETDQDRAAAVASILSDLERQLPAREQSSRPSTSVKSLPKLEQDQDDRNLRGASVKRKVATLKGALHSLFSDPVLNSALLVQLAKLEDPKEALETLRSAAQKTVGTREKGQGRHVTDRQPTFVGAQQAPQSPILWVFFTTAFGFLLGAMIKPVLEALGKVLVGEPLSRILDKPQLLGLLGLPAPGGSETEITKEPAVGPP